MSPSLAAVRSKIAQAEFSFATDDKPHALMMAAQTLVGLLAKGQAINVVGLRAAMEGAFGASDAEGAWRWKDAYEALEAAQVLFLRRYGPAMVARANREPSRVLAMLSKIGALLPSETRRSEESHALQQFSTPLEFAYVASLAAGLGAGDIVLEPSAGTGMLAIHAELARRETHSQRMGRDPGRSPETAVFRERRSAASTARSCMIASTPVLPLTSC